MITAMWHDVHSHPQQLEDPEGALRRARECGVRLCIAGTEKPSEAAEVFALHEKFPDMIVPAAGLHPATATELAEEEVKEELRTLRELIPRLRVISEIGLDYKYAATDRQKLRQREILEEQFALAGKHRLPVQLHSRWAQRPAMEAAMSFVKQTNVPALLHWFTASRKLVRIVNRQERLYISVGPSVLYSEETRRVVAEIAPDHLLLETDCPVPIGGRPNEPARAAEVARAVARIHGLAPEELAARLEANLSDYLGM